MSDNSNPPRTTSSEEGGKWPLKNIVKPIENDVMCGRGAGTNHHTGNRTYREMVKKRKIRYARSSRIQKPLIANEVIREVRGQEPPGRFLDCNNETGLWYDIGDDHARKKVIQALREGAPKIREEQRCKRERSRFTRDHSSGSATLHSTLGSQGSNHSNSTGLVAQNASVQVPFPSGSNETMHFLPNPIAAGQQPLPLASDEVKSPEKKRLSLSTDQKALLNSQMNALEINSPESSVRSTRSSRDTSLRSTRSSRDNSVRSTLSSRDASGRSNRSYRDVSERNSRSSRNASRQRNLSFSDVSERSLMSIFDSDDQISAAASVAESTDSQEVMPASNEATIQPFSRLNSLEQYEHEELKDYDESRDFEPPKVFDPSHLE